MADIKGRTIAATYKKLLYTSTDDGLEGNTTTNTSVITTDDGDGTSTASCLNLGIDRVGIGTTTPEAELHISSTTADTPSLILDHVSEGLEGANLTFRNKDTNSELSDTTVLGEVIFQGYDNASSYVTAAYIRCKMDGVGGGAGDVPGELAFVTSSGSSLTRAMTISKDQDVGIGTATPANLLDIEFAAGTDGIRVAGPNPIIKMIDTDGEQAWRFANTAGLLSIDEIAADGSFQSRRVSIEDGGNVGIGTGSPAGLLHVYSTADNRPAIIFEHDSSGDADEEGPNLYFRNKGNGVLGDNKIIGDIIFQAWDNDDAWISGALIRSQIQGAGSGADDVASDLTFWTNPGSTAAITSLNPRMIIAKDGRVGIGDTSPSGQLEISGGSGLTTIIQACQSGLVLGGSNQTSTAIADNDFFSSIGWYSHDANSTIDGSRFCAAIGVQAAEEFNASDPASQGVDMRFYVHPINETTNTPEEAMCIVANGNVGIGTSEPNALLELNMSTTDGVIMTMASTDVTHTMTDEAEADVFGEFEKVTANANGGGLAIRGYMDSNEDQGALVLNGRCQVAIDDTKSALGHGAIKVAAQIRDGTSVTAPDADANLFTINAGGNTTVFIVDREGDVHSPTTSAHNAFVDDYDDVQLIRAFDHAKDSAGLKGMVRQKWDEFVQYKEQDLIDVGVLYSPVKEGGFTNTTQLQRLHNGAIWQQYTEMQKMKELMYDAMVELMGKDKADKKLANHDIKLLDENLSN